MEQEYLELDQIDLEKVVIYEKWIKEEDKEEEKDEEIMDKLLRRVGLITNDGKYHKYCGYNKFTKETFILPLKEEGWKDHLEVLKDEYDEKSDDEDDDEKYTLEEFMERGIKYHKRYVKKCICDPTVKMFEISDGNVDWHVKYTKYQTQDNGGIGFVVYIGKNTENNEEKDEVFIYARTNDLVIDEPEDYTCIFNQLVKKYEPVEIFIGKSPLNKMTDFSGGHGDKWDGNSILLRINNDNEKYRYVHVGVNVFEFETDELITKYASNVGNNCVPYPYAESLSWCYSMSDNTKTPIGEHPNREYVGYVDYIGGKTYIPYDNTKIWKRDTENNKYQLNPAEDTRCCRFTKNVEFTIPKNTCNM